MVGDVGRRKRESEVGVEIKSRDPRRGGGGTAGRSSLMSVWALRRETLTEPGPLLLESNVDCSFSHTHTRPWGPRGMQQKLNAIGGQ